MHRATISNAPSPRPSPPVGERVPAGRWRAAPVAPGVVLGCLLGVVAGHAAGNSLLHERFEGQVSGVIRGGVTLVNEVVGYGGLNLENRSSARFDGQTNSAVCCPPEIRLQTTDFTVEAFVKPEEGWDYAAIAGHWAETTDQRAWALVLTPGNGLRFDIMPDGRFHAGNALTSRARLLRGTVWYHVAAVSQGNSSRLYVNGRLIAEKTRPLPGIFQPKPQTGGIMLGNLPEYSGKPRPFAGLLDEVRITPRALAPAEFLTTREPMPAPKGPVPERYELPFTATTREAAEAWQKQARARLLELVTKRIPRHSLAERPLDFQIAKAEPRTAYTLHHASFQGNDGRRYACLWAVPKGQGPFPAILALHGHGGKAEEVFDPNSLYRGFADRLASRGYCVMAPSFPHRPFAAEALWDLFRCVDILAAQPEVDARRLGVMGLSMGGEWTMWIAACDERLKAAVISGWMCTTEGVFAVFNCPCWELPGLVEFMDVCEVNLLLAPRPVLFESAESDPCFLLRYTRDGFKRIQAGYRVFGAGEAAIHDVFPGGHTVHGDQAYPFLDRVLRPRPVDSR